MKKVTNFLFTILTIGAIVLSITIMVQRLEGKNPSLFGYRLFQVVTGSMEPEYMTGDILLVRETSPEFLSLGDDITYRSIEGATAGLLVTHRIIEAPYQDSEGIWHIQTEGIAFGATPDPKIVGEQVLGRVLADCKILTHVYKLFSTKFGLILFLLPLILMMTSEIIHLISLVNKGDSEDDERNE